MFFCAIKYPIWFVIFQFLTTIMYKNRPTTVNPHFKNFFHNLLCLCFIAKISFIYLVFDWLIVCLVLYLTNQVVDVNVYFLLGSQL